LSKRLQTYETEAILVTFDPNVCTHSAKCLSGLPNVFDVSKQRWIRLENADAADVAATVRQCPSGALQYRFKDPSVTVVETAAEGGGEASAAPVVSVRLVANGPLVVEGPVAVSGRDGTVIHREGPTSFCRCGASQNKPFCDGAHRRIGFEG
jgi:uncharacterized Fe-S cluster protein YjdI